MDSPSFDIVRRDSPLVVSIPHLGHRIPDSLLGDYAGHASRMEDSDSHLDVLYDFAHRLDATVISARLSRYVIDLNRPPGGESLYPGMTTTGLCPTETFDGKPLYRDGRAPSQTEISRRVWHFWQPYHDTLRAELARLRGRHAHVLLWEAHSIASRIPRLFDGKLPDYNFGTAEGRSCAAVVQESVLAAADSCALDWVANGRFKGGYITRAYGRPADGVHAVQLEMCKSLYMDEAEPFALQPALAPRTAQTLEALVTAALGGLAHLQPGALRQA